MSKDKITGIDSAQTFERNSFQHSVPVYEMVGLVAQGVERSGFKAVNPGGALPNTPALQGNTEVYLMVADLSHGQGYGPGNALVPIPSHFL